MMDKEDTFHVTELFLLAAAFEADNLFGLPDKRKFQLQGSNLFDEANKALIEKEILTPEGKITKGGAYVIRSLEFYYFSEKFVRINNLMFGFPGKEEQEVIVLVEVEEQTYYRLYVMSKMLVLKLLMERFPLMTREPADEEKDFLTKEIPYPIARELSEFEPGANLMNVEIFHIEEHVLNESEDIVSHPSIFREARKEDEKSEMETNVELKQAGEKVLKEEAQVESTNNVNGELNNLGVNDAEKTLDEQIKQPRVELSYQYDQWLVFSKDDKLYMVDPYEDKYYQASQYWFLKVLFDELEFPYKEVTSHG